ncbi:FAD-dependent oxidoreductase [uncultured Hoeflea sp.]|uniref:NAD(P)/FAD-dependent oxidoreductase n=1 Tax=uncultured Hoeflea sp. TaxID=538666 RepID=UPI0026054D71|nr:FAD-dependent oxidoreductase [uncultured Hoeflea sp.]
MGSADSFADRVGQAAPDLLIAGAGVAGLWLGLKAAREGLSVLIVERDRIGAGASGGFLGALMPHSPDRWNGKKAFQFAALVDIESEIARLEAETGLECGYRRVGRLLPLANQQARRTALDHVADARANWGGRFGFEVGQTPDKHDWPNILWAPHGLIRETLSARLSPPLLVAALAARLSALPNVSLCEGVCVNAIDVSSDLAHLSNGESIGFGHLALASGVGAFSLVAQAAAQPELTLGGPVKGQAALLDADAPADLPLVYHDGVYVIAHDNGQVAIGSTSEREFDQSTTTDERLEALIKRARKLCPLIRDAPVVARWANVRPRAIGRDPMLGPVPGAPRVLAMAGGFKISFGIAHRMADFLVAEMTGGPGPDLPESFSVGAHIGKARALNARPQA